ncbi:MAG: copper resistance protein CopC [Longimicrobiaceae bacterium]
MFAAALLLASPAGAWAHAGLLSSRPAAGDTLREAPTRVVLRFTEPVEAGSSGIVLIGLNSRVTLTVTRDPHDVAALVAELPPLAPGGYRVQWHTLSADGHTVGDSFVFFVAGAGAEAGPAPPEHPEERLYEPKIPRLAPVLRGMGVGALAALAGVLLLMAASHAPAEARVRRVALALACAAALLLAAHALAWADYARRGPEDAPLAQVLFQTGPGRVEAARAGLALLALWALALARRTRLALAFAAAAVAATGLTGHSAGIHPAWTVPAKAIHVAAVAVWLGGLAVLFATLRRGDDPRGRSPLLRAVREKGPGDEGYALAARISTLSLAAVVALLVSGVVQTLLFAPSLGSLARSGYGAVLAVKLAGTAVLVAFGARNRYLLLPRLPADDARAALRRAAGWELAVMSIVLLAAGVLAYVPVPRPDPPVHVTHVQTN